MDQTNKLKEHEADDLNKRLTFLQQVDFFSILTPKQLMPIAVNMNMIKYKYGEYLVRAGEVPNGMLMIYKG